MSVIRRVCAFVVAAVFLCAYQASAAPSRALETFSQAGDDALATLLQVFYAGDGLWRDCNQPSCNQANSDWGTDSLTDVLYLRWALTHDPKIPAVMAALVDSSARYPKPCTGSSCPAWSDTPAWDAVTLMRAYEMIHDPRALARAEAAFQYVTRSKAFMLGACPEIPYQQAQASGSDVKTLETDANAIKAALLLYRATRNSGYLDDALSRYAADRRYYLDAQAGLYTVHVIDDGAQCEQVPRRFFASVNGDMIWNGVELSRITGHQHFYEEAIATARAVDANLSDNAGVFADLPGENDVAEPLVEAMYDLATKGRLSFAREWILRNATAALSARAPDGTYPRFFGGPPQSLTSVWESNGGLALEIAAAALDPDSATPASDVWDHGRFIGEPVTTLPATIEFKGAGVALVGTISDHCKASHIRVYIDGVQTFDRTGLWQNLSMPVGDSVLFAWRWAQSGEHTIRLEPGDSAEIGASVVHLQTVVVQSSS